MATILCIETTTTNCSVALSVEGIVVSLKEENDKKMDAILKFNCNDFVNLIF